ncbi:hypothetical protein V490_04304 [Pseudogymnoascus sp. VKM F-3557]|nr:hypothetical protein V490_04304 [Pseudogymnoascus sp. VKM F-3557]
MKFTAWTACAIASVSGTMALPSPVALEPATSLDIPVVPQRMTTADRFAVSGLDYMTWANKMVAEGKMYWSNHTSTEVQIRGITSFSVTNIACGYFAGDQSNYETGKAKFCSFAREYYSLFLLAMEYDVKNGVCEGTPCLIIADIAFYAAGAFTNNGVQTACGPIFDKIWASCPNSVGGSGILFTSDDQGAHYGDVHIQFFDDDDGDTCPANTATSANEMAAKWQYGRGSELTYYDVATFRSVFGAKAGYLLYGYAKKELRTSWICPSGNLAAGGLLRN